MAVFILHFIWLWAHFILLGDKMEAHFYLYLFTKKD